MILSDGRALDEEGNPYGEDVYSNYKIHIRVQWRANEELHVLHFSYRLAALSYALAANAGGLSTLCHTTPYSDRSL